MTADATQCPICGAERPANAPDEPCSRCHTRPAPTGDQVVQTGLDSTVAHVASDEGHSPGAAQAAASPFAAGPGQTPDPAEKRLRESGDDDDCISVDQFISVVDDLGLLDGADARALLAKIMQSRPSCNSRELGQELVTAGRLTAYQAGAIGQAKAKGLLIGRYTVLDKLGAGGMGMVFKAQHRRLKQVVALKNSAPLTHQKRRAGPAVPPRGRDGGEAQSPQHRPRDRRRRRWRDPFSGHGVRGRD